MSRFGIARFLLMVLVFCIPILVSCTSESEPAQLNEERLKECTIQLKDIDLTPSEEELKIDVAYSVHNPNNVQVTLCAIRYDIRVPEFLLAMVDNKRLFLQYPIPPGGTLDLADSSVAKPVGPYAIIWPKLMAGELKVWKFDGVAIIAEKPQFTPFSTKISK